MARRQIILLRPISPEQAGDGPLMEPLGTVSEIIESVARFNTAPDGGEQSAGRGTQVLHGPGMILEIPTGQDQVQQVMATFIDDDIAWPVLLRLCGVLNWTMMDPDSGRTYG